MDGREMTGSQERMKFDEVGLGQMIKERGSSKEYRVLSILVNPDRLIVKAVGGKNRRTVSRESLEIVWTSADQPEEPYVPVIKRELHGRTGYSVHLTFDVMGVESREEARDVIMSNLPKLEGVKVTNVHVGKYVISSLAPGLEDTL